MNVRHSIPALGFLVATLLTTTSPSVAMAQLLRIESVQADCEKVNPLETDIVVIMTIRYWGPTSQPALICPGTDRLTFWHLDPCTGALTDVTQEYGVAPFANNPTTIPSGGQRTDLNFNVTISGVARPDLIILNGEICIGPCNPPPGLAPGPCDIGADQTDEWLVLDRILPIERPVPPATAQQSAHSGIELEIANLDGDVDADLLVGIDGLDYPGGIFPPATDAGGVQLYDTQIVFTSQVISVFPTWPLLFEPGPDGPESGSNFGHTIVVGDFDDSGHIDIAVGAPTATDVDAAGTPHSAAGEVFVFFGPMFDTSVEVINPNPVPSGQFGHSLARANLDGVDADDLIVGEPRGVGGTGNPSGLVHIFTLNGGVFTPHPRGPLESPGPEIQPRFGHSIAAGDIYKSGRDGVVVGAPDAGAMGEGIVYAFPDLELQAVACATWSSLAIPPIGALGMMDGPRDFGTSVALGDLGTPLDPPVLAVGDPSALPVDALPGFWPLDGVWRVDLFEFQPALGPCAWLPAVPAWVRPCPEPFLSDRTDETNSADEMELRFSVDDDVGATLVVGLELADPCRILEAGEVFGFRWPVADPFPADPEVLYFREEVPQAGINDRVGQGLAIGQMHDTAVGPGWSEVVIGVPGVGSSGGPGRVVLLQD